MLGCDVGFFSGEPGSSVVSDMPVHLVSGLHRTLQYFRVRLSCDGALSEHLVVSAFSERLGSDETTRIALALDSVRSDAALAVVVDESDGWSEVVRYSKVERGLVAAAMALIKTVAGWEETSPIAITVDAERFYVNPELIDREWRADVMRLERDAG
jgi:predicted nucleic acid-binding protein